MDDAQTALWECVQQEGIKMIKQFNSLHIHEDRYMLHNREVAVLYEIGDDQSPIDCYYLDETTDIRDFFLLQKDPV